MSGQLEGKRAVVTGGGTGIGQAISAVLGAAGAQVALIGRRHDPLVETAAAIRDRGGKAHKFTADVGDRAQITAAVDAAADAMGGLDVLVNNAGVGGPNGCALEGPDRWQEILRTNLDGVFFTTRAALRHIGTGGRVVSISSVLGRFGVPGYTAYCASKHGVIGFTKALALELAPRQITANAVCPGWTDTVMAKEGMQGIAKAMGTSYEEARRSALAEVPLGRMIEPVEIGALVLFLCSPLASGMTGQAISHCGGQVMW